MSKIQLLKESYEIIGDFTPLKNNCGDMCDQACCVCEGCMILFPEEKKLMQNQGYSFSKTRIQDFGIVDTMICTKPCDRNYRPLACRVYPLAPKIVDEEIFVRLDVRARPTCPLCHNSISALDMGFVKAVKSCFIHLSSDDDMYSLICSISKLVDMYAKPFI